MTRTIMTEAPRPGDPQPQKEIRLEEVFKPFEDFQIPPDALTGYGNIDNRPGLAEYPFMFQGNLITLFVELGDIDDNVSPQTPAGKVQTVQSYENGETSFEKAPFSLGFFLERDRGTTINDFNLLQKHALELNIAGHLYYYRLSGEETSEDATRDIALYGFLEIGGNLVDENGNYADVLLPFDATPIAQITARIIQKGIPIPDEDEEYE